jgi:hypothetical protein
MDGGQTNGVGAHRKTVSTIDDSKRVGLDFSDGAAEQSPASANPIEQHGASSDLTLMERPRPT